MHKYYLGLEESTFVGLLILGLLTALVPGSMVMHYIVAFLAGAFFGWVWWRTRKGLRFKYFLMTTCFIIGYILGHYINGYGSVIPTIIVYSLGIALSYRACDSGYFTFVDF